MLSDAWEAAKAEEAAKRGLRLVDTLLARGGADIGDQSSLAPAS